jgi:hypothetical protein
LDDAKAQLNITSVDAARDAQLQRFVDSATRPVERALGRVVDQRSITDEVMFVGAVTSVLLRGAPVIAVTGIEAVDGSTTWSTDPTVVHVNGESGRLTLLSGPPLTGLVSITYTAGYAVVPAEVELAALIIIQHLWETKRGTMRVSLGGDDEPIVPAGYAIPNRALELLGTSLPGVA